MATRRLHRRTNLRVNPNLPIHSLHSSLNKQDDEITSYPFEKNIPKLTVYPKRIDIVHLLHDIHALKASNVSDLHLLEQIKMEVAPAFISLIPELAEFVKYAVNKIVTTYYYNAPHNNDSNNGPNWMLLLFHNHNHKDNNVLNIISPILPLFDVNIYYDKYKANDYMISLISSLCIIRNKIPPSWLKGIDHQLQKKDDSKYHIDYTCLFGDKLVSFLLLDLCKYIMTFLDIKSFFLCSLLNNTWLHFIYRNDTFLSVYKQIIHGNKHIKCELFDHSILSQIHIPNAPITIGWTLSTHNNSYLDFVTLKNHWFQQYINVINITLQKKEYIITSETLISDTETLMSDTETINDQNWAPKWIDVKQEIKSTNEIGFDSIIFKRDFPFDIGEYRIKLEILAPFKSVTIYSNVAKLDPIQWTYQYNESKARDEDYQRINGDNNDRKLFHIHKFWFEFYVDLLESLNTNVISDVLKNIRICQNRIKMDYEYLKQQYNEKLFKTIIRYILHENNKIKLNAIRCLRRIVIQDKKDIQSYYLDSLSKYGLIKICVNSLYKIYDINGSTIGNIREQMLWFLGYHIKSGWKWKSILMKEININKFIKFLIQEITINRQPKYTASYIWALSKFFSIYHQKRADDLSCDNGIILDTNLGKICIELMWNSFKLSFNKYKKLKLEECADKREQQMMQMTDSDDANIDEERKQKEVERRQEMDGLHSVVRDSYYGYLMILKYYTKEIFYIIDMNMLKNIINDFDLAIDGMDYEFALRMVRTSLSCCIDTIFRLNKCNEEIFKYSYLEKLYSILDAMIAKLKFLIMIKEKNINMFNDDDEKPKEDQFMMLFAPILEAIPIIGTNISILDNAKPKLIKLLYLIVDIAVLYNDYLNVCDLSNESKAEIAERKLSLQDQICCTMSVIWDILSKYGRSVREYIINNNKIMDLIEYKWAVDDNMVTANQAQSLLAVLRNDNAFNALFGGHNKEDKKDNDKKDNENEEKDFVYCPCGDILKLVEAKDCYPPSTYSYLYCDYCREKIDWGLNPTRMVYHCDKKEKAHPHGFDLCVNCAKRKLIIDINQ